MKVLSLMQPWATLIALGHKRYETRSWNTPYRGRLAIHASQKVDKPICQHYPFDTVLSLHGYSADNLPTGVILAHCQLIDTFKIFLPQDASATIEAIGSPEPDLRDIRDCEWYFGDYRPGRYAWELGDVVAINPIPAKGRLGLWEYPLMAARP